MEIYLKSLNPIMSFISFSFKLERLIKFETIKTKDSIMVDVYSMTAQRKAVFGSLNIVCTKEIRATTKIKNTPKYISCFRNKVIL